MEHSKKAKNALNAAAEMGAVVKRFLLDETADPLTVVNIFRALSRGEFQEILADMALGHEEKQWRNVLVYKFVYFLITGAEGVQKTTAYEATAHVFRIDSSYARKLFKGHEGDPDKAENLFLQFVQQHLQAAPTSMEAQLAEANRRALEAERRAEAAEQKEKEARELLSPRRRALSFSRNSRASSRARCTRMVRAYIRGDGSARNLNSGQMHHTSIAGCSRTTVEL